MKNLRFGLVGYGAWGKHHACAIEATAGAELAAIAARSVATCQAARAEHPNVAIFDDHHALLARADVDVVAVVVPSYLHYEVGKAALEAGKHLLLEKPMALDLAQCQELIALAEARGKVLAVGHELRLSPLWGKVKKMVDAGNVGEPLYLLIELWRGPYRRGSDGWRYDPGRVGSWVLEEPVHFFDLARWYLGRAGEPTTIYAQGSSRKAGHTGWQDNFSAVVTFPQGAYAVIAQTLAACEHHLTVKLTGTGGSLWAGWSGAMDRDMHPRSWLKYHDGKKVAKVPLAKPTGEVYELREEIAMMVRAVSGGSPVAAGGTDGQWAVALCLAGQRSAETGKVIALSEFLTS